MFISFHVKRNAFHVFSLPWLDNKIFTFPFTNDTMRLIETTLYQ
nr:MAG TPA: hypothetical protein [Caudoviricetes sp.]